MSSEKWESFFKSPIRSAGFRCFTEGKVSFSQLSDTEVMSYVKASTSFKVSMKSDSISDPVVHALCSCPQAKKGQLCKHIWASVLAITEKSPEFFTSKNEIRAGTTQGPTEKENTFAKAQADYRKLQYQKQKQRMKEFKKSKKSPIEPELPQIVQSAFAYFNLNGFSLESSFDEESIYLARKKLSRIFHPDVGGSHSEILELNNNCDILLKYLGDQS